MRKVCAGWSVQIAGVTSCSISSVHTLQQMVYYTSTCQEVISFSLLQLRSLESLTKAIMPALLTLRKEVSNIAAKVQKKLMALSHEGKETGEGAGSTADAGNSSGDYDEYGKPTSATHAVKRESSTERLSKSRMVPIPAITLAYLRNVMDVLDKNKVQGFLPSNGEYP
ncbi:hypothetical protein BD770DRAFT_476891 [Pilaira anomala]|nr:hypothetical protein BD770DRAFT_476891 [Pilaira anomala]